MGITPATGKVSIYAKTDKKIVHARWYSTATESELASGGDVDEPASPTDEAICRFDLATVLENY